MKLGVYFEDRLTGEIEQTENGGMQFKYHSQWLKDPKSFALSFSLPKQETIFTTEAENYFSNFLPEGPVRDAICRKHGISIENDFALLKKIGGECAGALVIGEFPTNHKEDSYEELYPNKIAEIASLENVFAVFSEKENMRLSLAGAQDKLPIYLSDDHKIFLPLGNAPSTHILKFANARFKGLVLNEYYATNLAQFLGLDTVQLSLMPVENDFFLIVKRFDRILNKPKTIKRLHQEDMCQALGYSHKNKYEKEGGPSFKALYELITKASDNPLTDNERLLKWQMVNVLIGNCDGHAKNISLLRTEQGVWSLTPFYDLVSTIAYPALSKELAMGVANISDIGIILHVHWKRMAESIGVNPKLIETMLTETLEHFPKALLSTHEKLTRELGDKPQLNRLREVLEKNYKIVKKR